MSYPVYALIDLGSHSVRLVLYRRIGNHFLPVFTEKATCALGSGMAQTGMLSAEGKDRARMALRRYAGLARAWKAETVTVLATAALREAGDGAAFAAELESLTGLTVTVISGTDEALYSAGGVLRCLPDASGVFADMGGSSIELAYLGAGAAQALATLPLGVLATADMPVGALKKQLKAALPKKSIIPQQTFYAVGGTWRALARHLQEQQGYPLRTSHLYRIELAAHQAFLEEIAAGGGLPRRTSRVSKARMALLPQAARMLLVVSSVFQSRDIVFSAAGLRSGYMASMLRLPDSAAARMHEDVRAFACGHFFHVDDSESLLRWLQPLLTADASQTLRDVLPLACILCDIAAFEAEGKRNKAAMALARVLAAPLVTLPPPALFLLAALLYASYAGSLEGEDFAPFLPMLDKEAQQLAVVLGCGLRLARTLCAHQYGALAEAPLVKNGSQYQIVFKEGADSALHTSEVVQRRLEALSACGAAS